MYFDSMYFCSETLSSQLGYNSISSKAASKATKKLLIIHFSFSNPLIDCLASEHLDKINQIFINFYATKAECFAK